MTNQLYPKGREGFLDGSIDWDTNDIRCCLVRGYTYNSAHDFLDDITTIVVRSSAFTTKTVTNGVADADDVTFTAVGAGADIESLVIYKYNAVDSAARLIAYIDTGTGFPISPDGSDVVIQWDATNKIFTL